ncbi:MULTISPECIES: CBO0543 family protein [Bacillaceae]|uniref:Uncharacterized protein n=1 Tax=Evansella alkalicola TaxID=745819 RepID=A0ABS6K1P5_9BACI|nr:MULTISPECIES: CBO0543 family protein [Bacillaceae]MBU9723300.1 hypothetical protein [Bacillus alkalicola]
MHLITTIIVIIAVILKGDWKNWEKFHTTMLYIALCNLAYNFLTANYFLWRLDADFLSNHSLTEMLYTFIVFPATVLMFLTHYPKSIKKQVLHNGMWITIYILWEAFFLLTGRIQYQYGWNIWWSLFILCLMFPFIRLHHTKPLLTYVLSFIFTVLFILFFDVPVHIPVELR